MLYRVRYPDNLNYSIVRQWIENNCQGRYYGGKDWYNWQMGEENRIYEFELAQDAVLFALRWS